MQAAEYGCGESRDRSNILCLLSWGYLTVGLSAYGYVRPDTYCGTGRTGARGPSERLVLSCGQPGLRGVELLQRRPVPGCVTERIDALAGEGFRLTNYCPESQCTPTRSALLTGRHAIRSGTHSVPIGVSGGWGLVAWEKTMGDVLSDAGYACAAYGKWHVGEGPGRWPTDKGFLEWYGPPRTYDEALWPTDPWYNPGRDPVSRMLEIKQGDSRTSSSGIPVSRPWRIPNAGSAARSEGRSHQQ
jgi:Sulfatase